MARERQLVVRRLAGAALLVAAAIGLAFILTNDGRDRAASALIGGLILGGLHLLRASSR